MNILIVESSAKCKTLLKHLGSDNWRVLPTGGHVERLPVDRKIHPAEEVKKPYWSNAPGELPNPPWFWTDNGEAAVLAIKDEAAKHDSVVFYLAPDPDREGERIAWHLNKILKEYGPCYRVAFNEITKRAVLAAVATPCEIDQSLVDAALIRSFVDRLVGWRASKIAKRYTSSSTNSMGRVQTPTLGFVVERELEREAHIPVRYYEVLATTPLLTWRVRFHDKTDPGAWKDEKGQFSAHRTADVSLASSAHAALAATKEIKVEKVERRENRQDPKPPFTTDTLMQAAGSRWGWSAKKTNVIAGKLYEAGHVTYIRTDSTRLAAEAVEAARNVVSDMWGVEHLGARPKPTTDARAQDAHEANRPTAFDVEILPGVEPDVQKLYSLIRARTLASLMAPSVRVTLTLRASCAGLDCSLEGSVGWYARLGWRRAFAVDGLDEHFEVTPVDINEGVTLKLISGDYENPNPELREDETKPPPRYKSHTLVKRMKDAGIGRPSTYAKTVERLEERGYVETKNGALMPTMSGRNIWLLAAPLFCDPEGEKVFDSKYTAKMELLLDDVEKGRNVACVAWEAMRDNFKAAYETARSASKNGALSPRTRRKLTDYLEAAPILADEIGDLDKLTEEQGRKLLEKLGASGICLLPTEKQSRFLKSLLEQRDMTLEEALNEAGINPRDEALNRNEVSDLIEHLKARSGDPLVPSEK